MTRPVPLTRLRRVAANLLLVVVTLVALAYLLPGLLGYERYVITGGSMSGTFEKGSIAVERVVPVADLAVGDVITYLPPADSGVDHLVTHRIVAMEPVDGRTQLRTQGDANAAPDPWAFQLAGATQPVVAFTVPALGYVFIALADPAIRIAVIGVPAGLVALRALLDLVRNLRRSATAVADAEAPTVLAA